MIFSRAFFTTIILFHKFLRGVNSNIPSCSSRVFCQGKLLDVVQRSEPYEDSKYFVDMRMRHSEEETLRNFKIFMDRHECKPSRDDIRIFVEQNFVMEEELERWNEIVLPKEPELLQRISVPEYRTFARSLMSIWTKLGRKIKPHVMHEQNISKYTIIPIPNGFVVPGGRFREFYYWDTYWVVVGLLNSGLAKVVRGMLENFSWLIEKYGFIPNGGRIYYLNRSQPPLLAMMIYEYFSFTKDFDWMEKQLPILEKEMEFWLRERTLNFEVDGEEHTLARYSVRSSTPRPESYIEDIITCRTLGDNDALKERCYRELKAAAESGWDFSSRWMPPNMKLARMKTSKILPVDLNSFLVKSFAIISKLFVVAGNAQKYQYWSKIHQTWRDSLHKVMYNEEHGIWFDYDTVTKSQNKMFYGSNFTPLWIEMYQNVEVAKVLGEKAVNYLLANNIMKYIGGVPSSLTRTGEQWDLPNAWPPLQSIVILGLYRSRNEKAQRIAKVLARRWINVNQFMFNISKKMFEKYDAEIEGEAGSGGEYDVQTGFGWTNGVILEFLEEFFTAEGRVRAFEKSCKDNHDNSKFIFSIVFVTNCVIFS